MYTTKKLILSILLVLYYCCVSLAQDVNLQANNTSINEKMNKQKIFNDIATEHNVVGMSLCIVKGSRITDSFNFGKRNVSLEYSVENNTLYKVASISKVVTAIAIMQLVEEELIDLDKDISYYLKKPVRNPLFEDFKITPRMLLSHTSSISDGDFYGEFLEYTHSSKHVPALYEIFEGETDIWLNKKPGSYFIYSNLNYGILGTIIEYVSGVRFDDYVLQNILQPLNIDGGFNISKIKSKEEISALYRGTVPQVDNYVNGNYPSYKEYPLAINGAYFSPQSGLRITMKDLSKIMTVLLNNGRYGDVQILKEESVAKMEKNVWIYNGTNGDNYNEQFLSWGLGLQKTLNLPNKDFIMPELSFIGHHGEAYGLIADMYYNKSKEIGFVLAVNGTYNTSGYMKGTRSKFYKLEEDIFDFIYNGFVKR